MEENFSIQRYKEKIQIIPDPLENLLSSQDLYADSPISSFSEKVSAQNQNNLHSSLSNQNFQNCLEIKSKKENSETFFDQIRKDQKQNGKVCKLTSSSQLYQTLVTIDLQQIKEKKYIESTDNQLSVAVKQIRDDVLYQMKQLALKQIMIKKPLLQAFNKYQLCFVDKRNISIYLGKTEEQQLRKASQLINRILPCKEKNDEIIKVNQFILGDLDIKENYSKQRKRQIDDFSKTRYALQFDDDLIQQFMQIRNQFFYQRTSESCYSSQDFQKETQQIEDEDSIKRILREKFGLFFKINVKYDYKILSKEILNNFFSQETQIKYGNFLKSKTSSVSLSKELQKSFTLKQNKKLNDSVEIQQEQQTKANWNQSEFSFKKKKIDSKILSKTPNVDLEQEKKNFSSSLTGSNDSRNQIDQINIISDSFDSFKPQKKLLKKFGGTSSNFLYKTFSSNQNYNYKNVSFECKNQILKNKIRNREISEKESDQEKTDKSNSQNQSLSIDSVSLDSGDKFKNNDEIKKQEKADEENLSNTLDSESISSPNQISTDEEKKDLKRIVFYEEHLFQNYISPTTEEILRDKRRKQILEIDDRCNQVVQIMKQQKNKKEEVWVNDQFLVLHKFLKKDHNEVQSKTCFEVNSVSSQQEIIKQSSKSNNQISNPQECIEYRNKGRNQQIKSKFLQKRRHDLENENYLSDFQSEKEQKLSPTSSKDLTESEIRELMKSPKLNPRGISCIKDKIKTSNARYRMSLKQQSYKKPLINLKLNGFQLKQPMNLNVSDKNFLIEPKSALLPIQKQRLPYFTQLNNDQEEEKVFEAKFSPTFQNKKLPECKSSRMADSGLSQQSSQSSMSKISFKSKIQIQNRIQGIQKIISNKQTAMARKINLKLLKIFQNKIDFTLDDLLTVGILFENKEINIIKKRQSSGQNSLGMENQFLTKIKTFKNAQNSFFNSPTSPFKNSNSQTSLNQLENIQKSNTYKQTESPSILLKTHSSIMKDVNLNRQNNSDIMIQKIEDEKQINSDYKIKKNQSPFNIMNSNLKLQNKKIQTTNFLRPKAFSSQLKVKTQSITQEKSDKQSNSLAFTIEGFLKNYQRKLLNISHKFRQKQIKMLYFSSKQQKDQLFQKNLEKQWQYLKKQTENLKGQQIDQSPFHDFGSSQYTLLKVLGQDNKFPDETQTIEYLRANILQSLKQVLDMSPAKDPKDSLPKCESKKTLNIVKARSFDSLKNFNTLQIDQPKVPTRKKTETEMNLKWNFKNDTQQNNDNFLALDNALQQINKKQQEKKLLENIRKLNSLQINKISSKSQSMRIDTITQQSFLQQKNEELIDDKSQRTQSDIEENILEKDSISSTSTEQKLHKVDQVELGIPKYDEQINFEQSNLRFQQNNQYQSRQNFLSAEQMIIERLQPHDQYPNHQRQSYIQANKTLETQKIAYEPKQEQKTLKMLKQKLQKSIEVSLYSFKPQSSSNQSKQDNDSILKSQKASKSSEQVQSLKPNKHHQKKQSTFFQLYTKETQRDESKISLKSSRIEKPIEQELPKPNNSPERQLPKATQSNFDYNELVTPQIIKKEKKLPFFLYSEQLQKKLGKQNNNNNTEITPTDYFREIKNESRIKTETSPIDRKQTFSQNKIKKKIMPFLFNESLSFIPKLREPSRSSLSTTLAGQIFTRKTRSSFISPKSKTEIEVYNQLSQLSNQPPSECLRQEARNCQKKNSFDCQIFGGCIRKGQTNQSMLKIMQPYKIHSNLQPLKKQYSIELSSKVLQKKKQNISCNKLLSQDYRQVKSIDLSRNKLISYSEMRNTFTIETKDKYIKSNNSYDPKTQNIYQDKNFTKPNLIIRKSGNYLSNKKRDKSLTNIFQSIDHDLDQLQTLLIRNKKM